MTGPETDTLRLRWDDPASDWVEAAPIGNGRIGAMVFGGVHAARVQINDATVWSGTPSGPAAGLRERLAAGAGPTRLQEVRDAIGGHDYRAATAALMSFQGPYSQEFLPFVDLWCELSGSGAPAAGYGGRELDLDRAVVSESFAVDGVAVRRRTWASRPAGALCVDLEADGAIDVGLRLTSQLRVTERRFTGTGLSLGIAIPADGAPPHEDVPAPLTYATGDVDGFDPFGAAALCVETDGQVRHDGERLVIEGATRVLITVSTSTNAAHWWTRSARPVGRAVRSTRIAEAETSARAAARLGSARLFAEHLADVRPLLSATRVRIGARRVGVLDVGRDVLRGGDDALTATVLLQFGRYLLVSSSRPGGPPANLQGIWNDQLRPPWSSNYTININTEMNYWGAEIAGLAQCHLPLVDLLDRLAENGSAVAGQLYDARGWVAHHNTDLWGWALPVGRGHSDPSWAIWMLGGSWLTSHLWQHYEYTLDDAFLRERAWPLLRGASEFGLSWLIDDGDGGWLRTSPSTSPENLFVGPDGHPEALGESCAADLSLLRKVFTDTLAAAAVLGVDDRLCADLRAALGRLAPPSISAGGWLQEWGEDHVEVDPLHRHLSQAVALYPLGLIHPESTPELADAARRLLDRRGTGAMGWSWAWKMALRARLGDGEAVRDLLREASVPFERDHRRLAPVDGSEWGGLLPNLFSTHPPCQIDGNYGFVAGILETILQSSRGTVRLLPALPPAWADGSARGVRAHGGLEVDLDWADGALTVATLRRVDGGGIESVRVVFRGVATTVELATGQQATLGVGDFAPAPLARTWRS